VHKELFYEQHNNIVMLFLNTFVVKSFLALNKMFDYKNTYASMQKGGKPSPKASSSTSVAGYKKTSKTVQVSKKDGSKRSACVYEGKRGGLYILRSGKMVPVPKKK
jgi:hypothetical protein